MLPVHLYSFKTPNTNIKRAISTIQTLNEVQNFWRSWLLISSPRDTARDQVHVLGGHTHFENSINRKSPKLKVKDAEPTLNMSRRD